VEHCKSGGTACRHTPQAGLAPGADECPWLFHPRAEAGLETLTLDVVKSSAIEGESLDVAQVRSSLARRLGIDIGGLTAPSRNVEGVVEMMLDATQHYAEPLSAERLFGMRPSFPPDSGHHGVWAHAQARSWPPVSCLRLHRP
jgi:hypothetical protein